MTISEILLKMLITAEHNMLHVHGIDIESRDFDVAATELAAKYGWEFDHTPNYFTLHGPRGPVKIRRGA
jgi:hypothetical protein